MLMKKESDEQLWLLGLRAWGAHRGEDGNLLLPLCLKYFVR